MRYLIGFVLSIMSLNASAYNMLIIDESERLPSVASSAIKQHCINGQTFMAIAKAKTGVSIIQVYRNDGNGNVVPQRCHKKEK